jgi:hypothetical protein
MTSSARSTITGITTDDRVLVYLAGPYTQPGNIENMALALLVAERLIRTGPVWPIVPHLTGFWDFSHPHPYEFWLRYDFAILARCDALFRYGGDSPGADREAAHATDLGIPVFMDEESLLVWISDRMSPITAT